MARRKRIFTVKLTAHEVAAIEDSLNAHLAGPCDEGDLCWNDIGGASAQSALGKLPSVGEAIHRSIRLDEEETEQYD